MNCYQYNHFLYAIVMLQICILRKWRRSFHVRRPEKLTDTAHIDADENESPTIEEEQIVHIIE